jgi:gliding motility-associated-like protein
MNVIQDATFFVRPLGNACAGYDSVHVHVELALAHLLGDSLICSNDVAHLHLIGAEAGSQITWAPADSIDAGQGTANATVSPVTSSTFSVHVVSPAGCVWNGSIGVSVSPINGSSVGASVDQPVVLPGTTVHLHATPSTGVSYTWSPANAVSDQHIANPSAFVTQTMWFHVIITDGVCTKSDSVLVKVYELHCDEPDIFVPDAFTPNGDGNNDLLFVRGRSISTLDFKLFDRWGELVFETTDQKIGWDATYNGKPVDPAVFVYWLKVTCIDGQEFFKKGNVTVIR